MFTNLLNFWTIGVMSWMTQLQPIEQLNVCYPNTDWPAEYQKIAYEISQFSNERAPLFEGDLNEDGQEDEEDVVLGQVYTAGLIVAIAKHETAFVRNRRGDQKHSVCFMQIHDANTFRIASGWTAEQIEADDEKCFDLGYKTIKLSFQNGGNLTNRLKTYTSGNPWHGTAAAHEICSEFTKIMELSRPKFCGW